MSFLYYFLTPGTDSFEKNYTMQNAQLSRRRLLQQMATISMGAGLLPIAGHASNQLQNAGPGTVYIGPGEGEKGRVGEMEITFKLSSKETSGLLGLWETVIQPGELGAPPHFHSHTDELCRVMEGSVVVMTGDKITEVKAGGWHLRPRGLVHTFWNIGPAPARTIDISLPGEHAYYMAELASLFENNKRPQPADFKRLEQKYDIHYRFDLLKAIMDKYRVKL